MPGVNHHAARRKRRRESPTPEPMKAHLCILQNYNRHPKSKEQSRNNYNRHCLVVQRHELKSKLQLHKRQGREDLNQIYYLNHALMKVEKANTLVKTYRNAIVTVIINKKECIRAIKALLTSTEVAK